MKELDDFNLIRAYAEEHSEAAFRELMIRHTAAVYSVCHRRLRDAHLAEDATQRTFVILARKAGKVRNVPIRPYLFRIATGCTADIRKERIRRERREARLTDSLPMTGESKQTRLLTAAMEEAFERLSERYRDALELRYVLDFSVPEVAESLRISVPAAKQRLVRGLAELRSRLSGSGALGVIVLPQMFQLLKPDLPAGLSDRTADFALHAVRLPHPGGSHLGIRRSHPRVLLGAGCVVACAALAVMAPQLSQPRPQPVAVSPPLAIAPRALPKRPALPATRPSFSQRLLQPYPPMTFAAPKFKEALEFTSYVTGVEIKCDWPSIEAAGVPRTTVIDTRGTDGNVLSEFNRIVEAADAKGRLECVVTDDSLLIRVKR